MIRDILPICMLMLWQPSSAQEIIGKDRANWKTPYTFQTPISWNRDTFRLSPPNGPSLSVDGWVDVRMPQGWRDTSNDHHWSYAFLWWIPGRQELTTEQLEQDLHIYYDYIVGLNVKRRKIPADSVVATAASLSSISKTKSGESFAGTMRLLNYFTRLPMQLNMKLHLHYCANQDHTAVIFLLSPKPVNHMIWEQLDPIAAGFSCE